MLTFREMTHEIAQVIRLLQAPLAHQQNVREIFANLGEEPQPNRALTQEQAVQRILIIRRDFLESVDRLNTSKISMCK